MNVCNKCVCVCAGMAKGMGVYFCVKSLSCVAFLFSYSYCICWFWLLWSLYHLSLYYINYVYFVRFNGRICLPSLRLYVSTFNLLTYSIPEKVHGQIAQTHIKRLLKKPSDSHLRSLISFSLSQGCRFASLKFPFSG